MCFACLWVSVVLLFFFFEEKVKEKKKAKLKEKNDSREIFPVSGIGGGTGGGYLQGGGRLIRRKSKVDA